MRAAEQHGPPPLFVPGEKARAKFIVPQGADAEVRVGQFVTHDLHDPTTRVLAVSGDRPEQLLRGQPNMWKDLLGKVRSRDLPVAALLHLGSQVHAAPYFEDAWLLLRRFA